MNWNACTEWESLAASVQWAHVLSVNGPSIPCSAWLWLGADGNEQIRGCDLGQNLLGRKQCRERQEVPWHLWAVSHPLLNWFVVWFYSPGQAAPMSYSHLSPHNSLSQTLEKPRFKAGCSPGKIPVAAEPEFLLISAFRAVPEVCACRKGVTSLQAWSHQPLEWSRQDSHGG